MNKPELLGLLAQNGILTDDWGQGKAKTPEHLLEEINNGEIELRLRKEGLLRTLRVAAITVYFLKGEKPLILKEDRQVFVGGRERRRNLATSLGEKMERGEDPPAAARRAMIEELGITLETHRFTVGVVEKKGPEESQSYPGLQTLYEFHHFFVQLPKKYFNPEGYTEEGGDKTTYFVWCPVEESK